MKKTILTLFVLYFGCLSQAQKIKEKDVLGVWKLVLNIEKAIEEEAEDADTMLEEAFINAISGLIGGIMDNIDIYFEFKENNKLRITVNTDDESETAYGKWFISKSGCLQTEGFDGDNFDIDTGNEWKLTDGILVAKDYEENRSVYMTKVD